MDGNVTSNVVVVAILILRIGACSFAEVVDTTLADAHRKNLLLANVLVAILVLTNLAAIFLAGKSGMGFATTAMVAYKCVAYPAIFALFLSVMRISKARMRVVWVLVAVTVALYCTAFFCPLALYATSDNRFHRGPLGYASYVVCTLIFAQIAYLAMRDFKNNRQVDFLLPVFGTLFIGICVFLDLVLGVDFVSQMQIATMANPIACDCVFLGIHLQLTREYQKTRLENQRTQLAISQIQPHFLYNTLTTIQSLCMYDPHGAARTTGEFATYLRQNLDTLSQSGLIPFSKELEHARTYAKIETTRFPNIEVSYRIEDADFMLPALSVQPLVENAIRHGVRVREHGLVCVTSRAERGFHIVEVRDNGKGFDVGTLAGQDNDEHIGIYNVRQRVRNMCGGELRIESVVDEGTCVSLRIPAKEDVA